MPTHNDRKTTSKDDYEIRANNGEIKQILVIKLKTLKDKIRI